MTTPATQLQAAIAAGNRAEVQRLLQSWDDSLEPLHAAHEAAYVAGDSETLSDLCDVLCLEEEFETEVDVQCPICMRVNSSSMEQHCRHHAATIWDGEVTGDLYEEVEEVCGAVAELDDADDDGAAQILERAPAPLRDAIEGAVDGDYERMLGLDDGSFETAHIDSDGMLSGGGTEYFHPAGQDRVKTRLAEITRWLATIERA